MAEKGKDKKTTWTSIVAGVGLLAVAVAYNFDGDPSTKADWAGVLEAFGWLTGIVGISLQGIFSKDNNDKE